MKALGTLAAVIAAIVAILALLYQTKVIGKETIIVEVQCDPDFWLEVRTLQSDGRPVAFANVRISSPSTPQSSTGYQTNADGFFRENMRWAVEGPDPVLVSEVSDTDRLWVINVRAVKNGFKDGYGTGNWLVAGY